MAFGFVLRQTWSGVAINLSVVALGLALPAYLFSER